MEVGLIDSCTGELLGGEERIDRTLFESCGDSLIVNLGSQEWTEVSLFARPPRPMLIWPLQKTIEPKDLGNWHMCVIHDSLRASHSPKAHAPLVTAIGELRGQAP